MYQFVTGPLAWVAFTVFFVGIIVRIILYLRGLDWQLDRVAYRPHLKYGIKGALRSIFFWLVPFGTKSWRYYKGLTILVFVFHIGLIFTPIFLKAHNIILEERWGFSFPTISEKTADLMTIAVIISGFILLLRRIAFPSVRILTSAYDILIWTIVMAPFVTGFMAYHQMGGDYQFWLILHILSGEIMLMAIPFTKLSHFILFFMSRMQLGMDFGIKRGGMKNKGFAW
jgi:nitrate reductase gamma subunit